MIFGRPFVNRFTLCYRIVILTVSLSVTLVYCGQTVGWTKVKLGTEVGLGPGHTVLDGDTAPPKGAQPSNFRPMSVVANGWMDQDATWYGGRPRPWPHCVRWGPSSPSKGHVQALQFLAHVCCGQTARWIKMPLGTEVDLGPGHIALDADSAPPKGVQHPPLFGPCLLWPNGRPSQLLLSSCF